MQKAIFFLKACYALLRSVKPLLKGRQGRDVTVGCFDFLTPLKTPVLSHQNGQGGEKEQSHPIGQDSTSPTLKPYLEQSSDRPAIFFSAKSHTMDLFFFFLNKTHKMPRDSDVLSHENCTNSAHPFLPVPLFVLSETILYFHCIWQEGKKNISFN